MGKVIAEWGEGLQVELEDGTGICGYCDNHGKTIYIGSEVGEGIRVCLECSRKLVDALIQTGKIQEEEHGR